MGFGEGRVLYIVDKLENAPEQSLFVLEEPETSLHENAQYELSKYLLDVCNRRHHQIIVSTHSSIFLSALPPESRKLLLRDNNGVIIHGGISANQVRSMLSDGHSGCIDICVEDDFAEKLLVEAIRRQDKSILKSIAIHQIGDKKAVGKAVNVLRETGKNAIAVRDPDVGEDITNKLYSFPGNFSPEKEVFDNEKVREYLQKKYGIDLDWLKTKTQTTDHHEISEIVANEVLSKPDIIDTFVIEEFLKENQDSFATLIEHIKNNI
jgi:ABC-type multidrug transport system ATPase subunit